MHKQNRISWYSTQGFFFNYEKIYVFNLFESGTPIFYRGGVPDSYFQNTSDNPGSMAVILLCEGIPFLGDPNHLPFVWVELHQSIMFPFL